MGTTIFAEMSALAVTTGAVNRGQRFPDVDGPRDIAQPAAASARAAPRATGVSLPPAELAGVADRAGGHDLLVGSDAVYGHMVSAGTPLPIPSLPGMAERTVTISSAAKTFSFTGWKVGWVTGSPELVTAVRTAKQFLTYVSSGPFPIAVPPCLSFPDPSSTLLPPPPPHPHPPM